MRLIVANHSSYPRIGDKPEQQKLRQALAAQEKHHSAAHPEEAYRRAAEEAMEEQARAGAEIITDGLVRWDDPVSRFAGRLSGAAPGKLRRFFDTDFYYRQPVFKSADPRRRKPFVLEEFKAAFPRATKAVLTGPYTLGALSSSRDPKALMKACAEALAAEVGALAEAGAAWIQIDEPALTRSPKDAGLVAQLLEPLAARRGAAKLALAVYFGPVAPLYDKLCFFPVDALVLDFTADREALTRKLLARGAPKALGLGVVDGRNARLEKLPDVLEELERLRPVLKAPENFLMPSCGLEFLPRDKAYEKLVRLREARDHFQARVAMLGSSPQSGPRPQGFT